MTARSSFLFGVLAVFVVLGTACTTAIPEIDETRFACSGDAPLEDGSFPCPSSHWCDDGACLPRFGCEDADAPGCTERSRRCDLFSNDQGAAVACRSGVHTSTSVRPVDLESCPCPDGTWCTVYGAPAPLAEAAYPLYVFPPGSELLSTRLASAGIQESPALRICARPCSVEANCPAGHTCRPAAVVDSGPFSRPEPGRSTIGVCYPDFASTVTSSLAADQPDPLACHQDRDCRPELGRSDGRCGLEVVRLGDHPVVPSAERAFGTPAALVPRCQPARDGSLKGTNEGCTRDEECASGLCLTKCARLCEPNRAPCPGQRQACLERSVSRALAGTQSQVEDRIFVCGN